MKHPIIITRNGELTKVLSAMVKDTLVHYTSSDHRVLNLTVAEFMALYEK